MLHAILWCVYNGCLCFFVCVLLFEYDKNVKKINITTAEMVSAIFLVDSELNYTYWENFCKFGMCDLSFEQ